MQQRIVVNERTTLQDAATNGVLRNTYFLLALTLAFSSLTAFVSMTMDLPRPNLLVMLVGFYGLLFLTYKTSNSVWGLLSTFAFTGFLGYTLGPILDMYVKNGLSDLILMALAGTALVFFLCSAYVLTTKRDMSFIAGGMMALFVVLLVGFIASFFFQVPALYLGLSVLFIIFSSGAILLETSNIIHGGERNYIRATISIYVALYNIFVSLLNLLSLGRD